MAIEILEVKNFDNGIWPIGDPTEMPDGCLVRNDRISPSRTGSFRTMHGYTTGFTPAVLGVAIGELTNGGMCGIDWDGGNLARIWKVNGFPVLTLIDELNMPGVSSRDVIQQAMFELAPPHAGGVAYTFVAGLPNPVKMDPNGVVSKWGIDAPPDNGVTATTAYNVLQTIDPMSAIAGWSHTGIATFTADTAHFVSAPASLKCTIAAKTSGTMTKTGLGGLFAGFGGADLRQDLIQLYISIDAPQDVRDIVIDFDLGTNFTTDYYSFSMPVSALVSANNIKLSTADVAQVDTIMQNILYNPKFTVNLTTSNQLMKEYYQGLKNYYINFPNKPANNKLKVSQKSAQAIAFAIAATIAPGNQSFWLISVPQNAFTRYGKSGASWPNVNGVSLRMINIHSTDTVAINFDQLQVAGGCGMVGHYQYLYTFTNANTGHYSMPNPTPVVVPDVQRQTVTLNNLPVSSDPQVTHITLWRTVGNGGVYFRLVDLPNGTTSHLDDYSDFIGFGSTNGQGVLSMEALVQNSIEPTGGIGMVCKYFNGTMFSAGGNNPVGRVFYSMTGDAEGIAGYTDVANNLQDVVGFAIFSNTLYCFTHGGVYQAIDQSTSPIQPLWTFQQVLNIPGAWTNKGIVETDHSIIYQELAGGLRAFNGFEAPKICEQITPLFKNETLGPYSSIQPIIASMFCNGEVTMSDGFTTFSFDKDQRIRWWGHGFNALHYDKRFGIEWGFVNGPGFVQVEHPGALFGNGNLVCEPKHWYSGEKYIYKIQRVFVDCNPNGNSLNCSIVSSANNGTYNALLGTISGTGRQIFEFGANMSLREFGVQIIGAYGSLVEIFRIAVEVDTVEVK